MLIHRLRLNNFSSFQDVDVRLSPRMNVIVGENNVGKSNFLRAIDFLRGLPINAIPKSWWPQGKGMGTLSGEIEFELESKELEEVENELRRDPNYKVTDPFHQFFGTYLEHKASWQHPDMAPNMDWSSNTPMRSQQRGSIRATEAISREQRRTQSLEVPFTHSW